MPCPAAGRNDVMAVIIHIPHASSAIPEGEVRHLVPTGEGLRRELLRMTDWYADDLFELGSQASRLVFPFSRLVVDPERFVDDRREPMAAKGMGAIYIRTSDGLPLRAAVDAVERRRLLQRYYAPHHEKLQQLVRTALEASGHCLIIDGHSFPSRALPCDEDQAALRPDICIGTDPFHTPDRLRRAAVSAFSDPGWRVELNRPHAGSIVPMNCYRQDRRVQSVMVEVNRGLYMDESTGKRLPQFDEVRERVQVALRRLVGSVPGQHSECRSPSAPFGS